MRPTHNPLVPLIQTLDDGIEFYRIAEKKTDSQHLKSVFRKMAEIRDFALAYLLPYINQRHLESPATTNRYAPLLNRIIGDDRLDVVQEVEEHLIDTMLDTSLESHNALVQCIIKDLIPQISWNFESCLNGLEDAGAVAA
ncbi:DUF2383 domain-containing protein [Saccharophagus sp. K07]|jgi:hypothetical protein|uniref:hypothetical protein n=1 Tax=Saccharophagus sp. K07 TaxID=2283636 RepID=UPI001651C0BD|nr:hypothetical protein [Saccharophagus sp. K07]MBC6904254.1 DUF2383 domain-containing protein [Saccharophagus sp. K07]